MADEFDVFDQLDLELDIPSVKLDTCLHNNISTEHGISECSDCGMEVKRTISSESKMYIATDKRSMGDGNRCWAPKKKTKGIYDELKAMGFAGPEATEADSIFKTVTAGGIFRVDKRRSIAVACLLEAYKILGKQVSLEALLKRMPTDNITAGMKIVETKIKKYDTERIRITHTSPVDSIRDILSKWDSDQKTIDEVISLYDRVDDKSSLINRSRAKSVAAGLIYYYALATKRSNIKLKDFSKRVELSESTITKLAKEISAILSTPEILAY